MAPGGAAGLPPRPEACLDPGAFVSVMGAKGVEAYEDVATTEPLGPSASVVASWAQR